MITLVLTNRNRDLRIVKNCLDSLQKQSDIDFDWFLVDYGSNENYLTQLNELVLKYPQIQYITCPTSGQLWNKSRAINIVLKKSNSPFFFVGDIDMIYHPEFISELKKVSNQNKATYFQVGFLSKEESLKDLDFEMYRESFKSSEDATGMTLYPTEILKSINGYDEFYHGWGAEDTDVHFRLANKGFEIDFFDAKLLMKHQWHPKTYRTNASTEPYHSQLEKINHQYIKLVNEYNIIEANKNYNYGVMPKREDYNRLENIKMNNCIFSETNQIDAFLLGGMQNLSKGDYEFEFLEHPLQNSIKNRFKSWLGKKAYTFYTLDEINDKLLSTIIMNFKNNPYKVSYNKQENRLTFKISIV